MQLTGSYRKVLVRPSDLKWRLTAFPDLDADEESPNGPIKALEIGFRLPSSSYATILLRELTHSSQSQSHHIHLAQELRDPTDSQD